MEFVRFGTTGLNVSRACLGTMTFGTQADEATSHSILNSAFERGISFVDTADAYPLAGNASTAGRSEEIIGRWMKGRRSDVIIATKFVAPMGSLPWQRGASRKHVIDAVHGSLRRLGTDHIDLYQVHHHDPLTPIEETLSALDDLVHAGHVRYIGCSNFKAYQLAKARSTSEARGWMSFASVQPRYNLLFRHAELELLPMCSEDCIAVIPYNPLAGGMLTGKYAGPDSTDAGRFNLRASTATLYRDRYWNDRAFATVNALRAIAAADDRSLAELAVAWVLAQPAVTAPIIGASRPEQLAEPLRAFDRRLDASVLERLHTLTTTDIGSPEW